MSEIIVFDTTISVTSADASNTYLVEGGTLIVERRWSGLRSDHAERRPIDCIFGRNDAQHDRFLCGSTECLWRGRRIGPIAVTIAAPL
jgi:hypothetical protein